MTENPNSIDIYAAEKAALKREKILHLTLDFLLQQNRMDDTEENRKSIKDILYGNGEIDILQMSSTDITKKISENNPQLRISGIKEAITIAHFYRDHETRIPDRVVIYSSYDKDKVEKERLRTPKQKVLVYYSESNYGTTSSTKAGYNFMLRKKPIIGETVDIAAPDVYINDTYFHFSDTSFYDSGAKFTIDGAENIVIGGFMGGQDGRILQMSLHASDTIAIMPGATVGYKDRVELVAVNDIYQYPGSINHALSIQSRNYFLEGGTLELPEGFRKPGVKIRIECLGEGEFVVSEGATLNENQLEILDKHYVQRQADLEQRRMIGDIGHTAIPANLVPRREVPEVQEQYPTVDARREAFDGLYGSYVVKEDFTQTDNDILRTRIFSFDTKTPEEENKLIEFLAYCTSIFYDTKTTSLPSGKVLVSLQLREMKKESKLYRQLYGTN